MNHFVPAVIAMTIGFIIGWIGGGSDGAIQADAHWQRELIERGHAEYHAQTGEWQWKDEGGQVDE